jgi:ADP-ribose pyrophosphatase YjhB (NUDIX family)
MSAVEYPEVHAAVAMILDETRQKFLWCWNAKWHAFSLPTARSHPRPEVRASGAGAPALDAAERVAAEVLGVPVVAHHARGLVPILERSGRDGRLKTYYYETFRAGPHDGFAERLDIRPAHIWLAGYEALSGDIKPLAASSVKVIGQLADAGLVPGRHQLASTVLLTRGPEDAPEFLMHANPKWGYSFPSKRRAFGESASDAAARVATEELGLRPDSTVKLRPMPGGPVAYHDRSESAGVESYYVHAPFRATLDDESKLTSKATLAWVPLVDIVNGSALTPQSPSGTQVRPGKVSRTSRRILEALGYF